MIVIRCLIGLRRLGYFAFAALRLSTDGLNRRVARPIKSVVILVTSSLSIFILVACAVRLDCTALSVAITDQIPGVDPKGHPGYGQHFV